MLIMCILMGLNTLWAADMDPYVILTVKTQEKNSNVVSGKVLAIFIIPAHLLQ